MADIGETCAGHKTNVPRADDCEIHKRKNGRRRISRSASRTHSTSLALSAHFRSLSLGSGIEVQIESKFRECFERHGKQDAVFVHAGVVAYHSPERGHPARQIAVNRVALLLENAGRGFILFLNSNAPVIIESIISTDNKQTAILEEWIVIQIAMSNVQLQIGYRLNARGRIDFRKTLGESRHLGVDRERHPGQRRKADIIKEV